MASALCRLLVCGVAAVVAHFATAAETSPAHGPTMASVLANSKPSDWRTPDPENTLYMELPSGRVVIELAPEFAPNHVANVKALVREHYFDGLAIERVQDDYVVQWGDPDGKRAIKAAKRTLKAEFDRPIASELAFDKAPDVDAYAPA